MTRSSRFVDAAAQHADTVLHKARDRWGPYRTPLLADGLSVPQHKPVRWENHGDKWVLSNAASQQNLLRTLCGLTASGRDESYRGAAEEIVGYTLRHARLADLVWWGGHCAVDLNRKQLVHCTEGLDGSAYPRHELKGTFPFYDLMFAVDPGDARRVVEGMWECHVRDWGTLALNRHNITTVPRQLPAAAGPTPSQWDREYRGGPVDDGDLGFMPAGIDLAHAAVTLASHTGDRRPLTWALRLVERYFPAEGSGLPVYQLGRSTRSASEFRTNVRPDRAAEQLGDDVGEHQVWTLGRMREALYCAICLLDAGERSGERGFTDAAVRALVAFVRHAFDADGSVFHPVLADGTRLTGVPLRRNGYFGAGGTTLDVGRLDKPALVAFAHGYRASGSDELWDACRTLAARMELGDLGPPGGTDIRLGSVEQSDPLVLMAVLALYDGTRAAPLLDYAERFGDRLVRRRLHAGLLVDPNAAYASIDALEPLALLHLARVLDGGGARVPAWVGGRGRFHALFDGHGRTTDTAMFYRARSAG